MDLLFVLVEPARPAHVGAAARALKTQGFSRLAIINSDAHCQDEARWVAHGATDILDQALVLPDVATLRHCCDVMIGTTARERGVQRHYHSPTALQQQLAQQAGTAGTVALLFGREASGLHNDELALCDLWSSIPLAQDYPSLSLGQAVTVYAVALAALGRLPGLPAGEADAGQLAHLRQRLLAWFDDELPDGDPKLREWLQERLPCLTDRDVRMAHQLLNRWLRPR